MDSVEHGTVTRSALREFALAQGIRSKQLFIPADGEALEF